MSSSALRIIEFLLSRYDRTKDQQQLESHLRESILREVVFNREMVDEARNALPDDASLSGQLVLATRTDSFDVISSVGISLTRIFDAPWQPAATYSNGRSKKYLDQLRRMQTEFELLERTYLRLNVQKVRTRLGREMSARSVNYLGHLLYESAQLASRPTWQHP